MSSNALTNDTTDSAPGATSEPDIDVTLETDQDTAPDNRLEYHASNPAIVTVTLTNNSSTRITTGELYFEASATAHVTPDVDGENLIPFGEPNTWEFLEALAPGESTSLTLSIKSDGLERDVWDGQIDIVTNFGMDIIAKTTVFIRG